MTVSKVQIANLALGHLGHPNSIESFSEASAEAKQANLWYDFSRKLCLESHNWGFARKRITLATADDDATEGHWTYRYDYPADALVIRKLYNKYYPEDGEDEPPYVVETDDDGDERTIQSDLDSAKALYTFDQQNTALFSNGFISALSYLLAYHMANVITGNNEAVREDMWRKYIGVMRFFAAVDGNQDGRKAPRDAEHIRARQ